MNRKAGRRLCLLLGVVFLVEAAGQQCPSDKQYEPAKPLGVSDSVFGSSQYNASPAVSNCCARGKIVSWTIQETGYSLNVTYIGALFATCSDGSILPPVNYGYNGTNAAFCDGALRQPQTLPTPDGNITARAGLLLDSFLDIGNPNSELVEIECPAGLSPVGFSAASMCLALTLFQVICAVPTAAAPAPVTSTLSSLTCPASVKYEPELPIGSNTSTWYFDNGGTTNLTASPAQAQCCPGGSVATWGIQTTNATSTTSGYIGSISATCSDGTSLAPVVYGYNGTDAALCNSTISQGVVVPAPSGNLTAIAGSILNSFLDVGDSSGSNPSFEIKCPPGQSPVGFSAASMCFSVTTFQVICGVPLGHGPALAPGALPPPLIISSSPSTPPAAPSAAPPLPGQQCAADAQYVPTTALGDSGSICGSIISWTLQTVIDSSPYSPYIGSITATCSDGSTVGPIQYGYNGTDGTRCDTKLRQPITIPAPNGNITARAGLLLDSLLNVGNNGSAMVGIQCAPGSSPVGFSAGSMCLALTTFQVVCDVPIAPSPSALIAPTPPPSPVSSPGQQCPAGVQFQPALPIGLNSSEWYYADGSFTNLTASPATADCCPSGNITTWSLQSTNTSTSAGFVGSITATCSDGSKLGPVVYGYNGTDAPLCNSTISQATQLSAPSGNITATGGAILNSLLNVGSASTNTPQFEVACGSGQSPVGFSAASMCYAITSFQVICGVPRQLTPAPAPMNGTHATTSSQSGSGSSSGGISGGAIGGIVAGVLVAFAALTFFLVRRRWQMQPASRPPAVKRNESAQAMLPGNDADVFGMPEKVRVDDANVYGKAPPSDSTPGSWNIPPNPLASDQKVPASGGLTIDSQDMKSVPQLGSDASSSKDTGLTLSDKSSGHRRTTKSGSQSDSLATAPSTPSDNIRLDELQYVCDEKGQPQVLGKGAYGQVLKGLLGKGHDIPVAIKAVHENTSASQRRSLLQEISLLRSLRHSNIVTLFGACQEGDTVLLVMEEMAGDLFHALHHQGGSELYRWKNRGRNVLLQLAEALNFIHFRRIIHFDLKTSNVLLTNDGIAKLTDVGLSGALGSKTHLSQSQGFTMAYAAPEVLLGRACKASSDIYSFGVIMWEVVTLQIPARGRISPIRVPEECPQELSDLIDQCLSVEPEERPTASAIIRVLQAAQSAA